MVNSETKKDGFVQDTCVNGICLVRISIRLPSKYLNAEWKYNQGKQRGTKF